MTKWIGHNARDSKAPWSKYLIWVTVPIVVFSVILLYGDKIGESLKALFSAQENRSAPSAARQPLNVDSLLYSVITDLGLDSSQLVAGYSNTFTNGKKNYPHYLIKWPQAYPLVWFTRNIQSACRSRDSLRYDAIELESERKLKLVFIDRRDTIGWVEVAADNRYKPAMSTAAIIFDNFNVMTKSQITSLVQSGIPFGYILNPDRAPDNDIGKILKTCRGECYLRVPTDKDSWIAIMKRSSQGNSRKSGKFNDNNLETILRRFPVIDGFFFDESRGVDKGTVKTLAKRLSALNLYYLDFAKTSGIIDTVLVENNIKIGSPVKLVDLIGLSSSQFAGRFKADFSRPAIRPKIIYLVASRAEYLEALTNMTNFRALWNIKIVPPSAQLEY
jgi:hypothetical protein